MTTLRTIEAAIPVAEVTLLEDRALVVRKGRVQLPPGRSKLVIRAVAPVLVDKTLAAALSSPEPGEALSEDLRVRSVSVARWRVTRDQDRPADVAQLRAEQRAAQERVRELGERDERLVAELQSLEQLVGLTQTEINEDVGWARQDRGRWAEQLEQLEAKLREVGLERARLGHEVEALGREVKDLEVRMAASSNLDADVTAELRLEFINPDPIARALDLRVDYLVPGALWRPWHTARLIEPEPSAGDGSEGARVVWTCAGCVWQATGEDWTDAAIVFSTERPSLGVSPPHLQTDRLRFRKRSSTVEVESREQTVHTAGLGADDSPKRDVAEDELPGIDDGGEALELRGRAKATIPGDGRPYRVPIFEFEAPAETALICAPELAAAVILRSRQANAAKHPLLAGPVDLVRRSGLVGRTSLLYIAPGERFELGWGPDSSLRVHREVEHLEQERRMMSSWTRKPRRVTVKLSNLSAEAKAIEVKERIAVSEVEKVEVEVAEASHGKRADEDGFVTWDVRLKGFGIDEVELTWTLVVHDDVVGLA